MRPFRSVNRLSDSSNGELGEIEVKLLVLQQLHVALNHAASGLRVRPADSARSAARAFPDVSLRRPPPGTRGSKVARAVANSSPASHSHDASMFRKLMEVLEAHWQAHGP